MAALALAVAIVGCDQPYGPSPTGSAVIPDPPPFPTDLPSDTYLAGMAQDGDLVYVAGGADNLWHTSSALRVFDLKSRTWSRRASMTVPRHTPGVMTIPNGVMVVGGRNGLLDGRTDEKRYEAYGAAEDTWTVYPRIEAPEFDGSYGTYMAMLDGKIYAAATPSSADGGSRATMAFTVIDGDAISRVTSSRLPRLMEPSVIAAEGKVWVMGRTAFGPWGETRMYAYDPVAGKVTEREAPRHNERGYANCCYYFGGRIFKVNTHECSANVMEVYTIATDTWTEIPLPYSMRTNEILHPIVTDRASGRVYFCSPPHLTRGFYFDPVTMTFPGR